MSRRSVKSANPDECRRKWREACGIGEIRVRPGSISEFVVLHGSRHLHSRTDNPDSLRHYATSWERRLGPTIGHLLWSELTPDIVQEVLTLGNSASIQHQDKIVFNHLSQLAIIMGLANPRIAAYSKFARLKKRKKKVRVGMAEKADNLFAAAQKCGSWMEGPIYTMKTIGLRKGELCGLKPTDIDKKGILTIQRQRNHTQGERGGLKGRKERRVIGLPSQVATALLSYHRAGSVYLFTKPDLTPIPYQHLDAEIKKIIKAVPGTEPCTIHDFRAAAVNRLIAAGVSRPRIAEVMGWSDEREIDSYIDVDYQRTCDTLSTVVPGG